jgi:hypothetical protein
MTAGIFPLTLENRITELSMYTYCAAPFRGPADST